MMNQVVNIDELLQKEVKVSGSSVYTNTGIIELRYDEEGKVIGVRAKNRMVILLKQLQNMSFSQQELLLEI